MPRSVVDRCLAKPPADRYPNAGRLRDALEALQTTTIPVAAAGTGTHRRPRALVVAAAALAIGALVAAVVLLRPRAEPARKLTSTGAPASPNREANDAFELAVQLQRVQNEMPRAMLMLERALAADPHFAEARRYHAFARNYSWRLTRGLLFARQGKRREALDAADDETLKFAAAAFPQTIAAAEIYTLVGGTGEGDRMARPCGAQRRRAHRVVPTQSAFQRDSRHPALPRDHRVDRSAPATAGTAMTTGATAGG